MEITNLIHDEILDYYADVSPFIDSIDIVDEKPEKAIKQKCGLSFSNIEYVYGKVKYNPIGYYFLDAQTFVPYGDKFIKITLIDNDGQIIHG